MKILFFMLLLCFILIKDGQFLEGTFKRFEGKFVTTLINDKEIIYLNSNNSFKCAIKCLRKHDCNIAVLYKNYCTLFKNCQIIKNYQNKENSVLFEKKIKCVKEYTNFNGNLFNLFERPKFFF